MTSVVNLDALIFILDVQDFPSLSSYILLYIIAIGFPASLEN